MKKNLKDRQLVKLFLDDVRNPKTTGWTVVRNYDEFVKHIEENGLPEEVSFDHDLADVHYDPETFKQGFVYHEKTGYDCAKWLVEESINSGISLPLILTHSANPIGSANIMGYINNFLKNQRLPQTCIRTKIPHTV